MHTAFWTTVIAAASPSLAAIIPRQTTTNDNNVVVGSGTQGAPLLESFFSYSIEFFFFPDYAGNTAEPNTFSLNLLESLGNYTSTAPIIRVGGNTQDYTIFVPDQTDARIGIYNTSISQDYPLNVTIGPSYFDSYNTWPGIQFTHGFDLGRNSTAARTALLDSVGHACANLEGGKLLAWELGNEPDLFKTSSQGPVRPADWNEQDYVDEWLNGTRAILERLKTECPDLATPDKFQWIAPSFAGTSNSLDIVRTFQDGLDTDNDISLITSHNYISGATSPGVTLQHTLMNHTSTVASIRPHVNESQLLANYSAPYILGETNSLYNEGAPGLSNSFGAALWGFDFNLHCAAVGIPRVHMHMGTDFRYAAWQPIGTNKTSIGTKPPFYGQVGAAAAVGDLSDKDSAVTIEELAIGEGVYDSGYAIYSGGALSRLAAVNLREYNYSLSSGGPPDPNAGPRPNQTYSFTLPEGVAEGKDVKVQRLMANGSDAITGVTFDGVSFNYELEMGRPVALGNVTVGETVPVMKGVVSVVVPDSSAVVLGL